MNKDGVNMTLADIHKEWETANATNALQMPYQRYQWHVNAYENSRQKTAFATSADFKRRFLKWLIFVSRWKLTCKRSKYVTNAYKY